MFGLILFSDTWKKPLFSLSEVISSDGAPCVPPLLGVKVPPRAAFPWPRCAAEEPLWEVLEPHSRGAVFGSCSLGLCVAYMQRNNPLGLDEDAIQQISLSLALQLQSLSSISVSGGSRMRISSGRLWCASRGLCNGPYLSGKGMCPVPMARGCSSVTQHGRGCTDRTTVLYALHWPRCKWCSLATAARLLAACK